MFALFLLFLTFSLLDMTIAWLGVHYGGKEIGILFLLSNDFQVMCFIKGIGTFLFGLILVAYKAKGLLAISCAVYFALCLWNGYLLWRTFT